VAFLAGLYWFDNRGAIELAIIKTHKILNYLQRYFQ